MPILLWLLGVPIGAIILLYLFHVIQDDIPHGNPAILLRQIGWRRKGHRQAREKLL